VFPFRDLNDSGFEGVGFQKFPGNIIIISHFLSPQFHACIQIEGDENCILAIGGGDICVIPNGEIVSQHSGIIQFDTPNDLWSLLIGVTDTDDDVVTVRKKVLVVAVARRVLLGQQYVGVRKHFRGASVNVIDIFAVVWAVLQNFRTQEPLFI
jgi:hypothetical protein